MNKLEFKPNPANYAIDFSWGNHPIIHIYTNEKEHIFFSALSRKNQNDFENRQEMLDWLLAEVKTRIEYCSSTCLRAFERKDRSYTYLKEYEILTKFLKENSNGRYSGAIQFNSENKDLILSKLYEFFNPEKEFTCEFYHPKVDYHGYFTISDIDIEVSDNKIDLIYIVDKRHFCLNSYFTIDSKTIIVFDFDKLNIKKDFSTFSFWENSDS